MFCENFYLRFFSCLFDNVHRSLSLVERRKKCADGSFFFFAQLFSHFRPFFSRLFWAFRSWKQSFRLFFLFKKKFFIKLIPLCGAIEFSRKILAAFFSFSFVVSLLNQFRNDEKGRKRSKTALMFWLAFRPKNHKIGMCSFVN